MNIKIIDYCKTALSNGVLEIAVNINNINDNKLSPRLLV